MKTTKVLLVISIFVAATSFTYAGPGAQYWAARRAGHANAAVVVNANAPKAGDICCRVVTKQRPIASHKVTMPVSAVECSGCAAMAAGTKCAS